MLSPATTPPIRVLIVDADRRVRDSLCDLIECDAALEAVAAVGTADEAARSAADLQPDVVVIDPRLPEVATGAGLLGRLRAAVPSTRLLVMSWSPEAGGVLDAADGLIDKNASPEALVAAIAASMARQS